MSASTAIHSCAVCGVAIDHLRRQARSCSSTCRDLHHRGEPYLPVGTCEGCGAMLVGARADARFCSGKCRTRAWRAARPEVQVTATNGSPPPSKVMSPGGDPDACTRCGSNVSYRDEDGDLYCFMCGRLREGAGS